MVGTHGDAWRAPAEALVLSVVADQWRFAVYNAVGILDGYLDLPADVDPADAQRQLIDRVEAATGLTYSAAWQHDKPRSWFARLTVLST